MSNKLLRLDAGCGATKKRAAPNFDAYTDIIPEDKAEVEPYFQVPLENMYCFRDKQFDFVRCHHAIEHCEDPDKACAELIRVGKRGIISFPGTLAEMCYGRKDHRWYVFHENGRLVFVEKFHKSLGVPRRIAGGRLNVNFDWKDSFKWLVIRP